MNTNTIIIVSVAIWLFIVILTPVIRKQAINDLEDPTLSAEDKKVAKRIKDKWWIIVGGSFVILALTAFLYIKHV